MTTTVCIRLEMRLLDVDWYEDLRSESKNNGGMMSHQDRLIAVHDHIVAKLVSVKVL